MHTRDFQSGIGVMKSNLLVKVSMKYLLVGLLILPFVYPGNVHGAGHEAGYSGALDSAIGWLVGRQNPDGSWGENNDVRTLYTSESVLALSAVGHRNAGFYQGVTWLSNHATTNVDFRARRIAALGGHGDSLAGEFSRLHAARRSSDNQAWGLAHGYEASVLDTSLALLAHSGADPDEFGQDAELQGALDYLAAQTLPEDPAVVAYLLRAVIPYRTTHTVSVDLVDSASAYLQAQVGDTDPPLTQALAALALSRTGNYPDKVAALLARLVALQETVGDDKGSWATDEYVTAIAIRAFSTVLGLDAPVLAENVYIPDPVLRRAINQALGRNSADALNRGELLRLTSLIAPSAGITNLTGLEMATNLATLDLNGNTISDLSPLSGLDNLIAAMDDSASTQEDVAVPIDVLANDIQGQGLTIASVTQPGNGAVTFSGSSVTYTPSGDYNGTDSFTYTATNSDADVVTATVTVTVAPVNDAPVAVADSIELADPTPITIDVLANDVDVDGDTLTTQSITPSPDANGTAVIGLDGRITYTPNPGFTGTDTFSYTIGDGALTAQGSLTVTVMPVPYVYYILNPGFNNAPAFVVSLADGNIITAGDTVLTLDRYQRGTIPMAVLAQGTKITGTGPFDIAGSAAATDVPLADFLAGQEFVIPQVRGNHWLYLLSPDGEATATLDIGGTVTTHALPVGQVVAIDAGADNTVSAIITTDAPILVAHLGIDASGSPMDASPVPPAATEVWGVQSNQPAYVGALEDLTTIDIHADDGTSITGIVLNAGDRYALHNVGISGTQGQDSDLYGSGIRIHADKPIGALQAGDGDGDEQTAFLPTEDLGIRFGLPLDTQYVAVVCPWDTTVTLWDGANPPLTKDCGGNDPYPGKIYFGSDTNGLHLAAGATIESSEPVYLMYEDSAHNGERSLLGAEE
uniref:Tandem-95 repeat protein n=1 Tax=Candidatus Kentrum sp. FW TaxID=2126338 RepID=A0A450SKI3_9GAMM|nr:MAG: hypothetical protein BECKFW1821B_GA0114236_10177 [Candidatus Kentron sp. FW]